MRIAATLLMAATLLTSALEAQERAAPRPGTPVAAALSSHDAHRYTLELDSASFVYGEVNQIDVDVVVRIHSPGGAVLASFDGPNRGAEIFQFETESAGTFAIEVAPFEGAEGDYELELVAVEPVAQDPAARLDQMMMPYSADDRPGVAIGVVIDGALQVARAYGMANLTYGIPFEPTTVSNIGSVTKQFTAMGLLLLEKRGKLTLDDDIRIHIPELPEWDDPVTLRNLLNHTGGYREVYNLLPMTGMRFEDEFDRERAIQIVQRQEERQAAPNTEFNYNNTGFILLSLVIERTSGQTFANYMKEAVFEPLGMSDTRVKMVQGEIIPGSAQGYVPNESGGFRQVRDLSASAGAGGIYTTLEDLTKWMLNYREQTLGGPEATGQMTTSAILNDGDATGYGLGLGIGTRRGRTLYTHTGGDVAHRAYLGYYPELMSGVMVLSNHASFNPGMGGAIGDVFLGDRFEPEEKTVASASDAVEVAPERLEAIAGDWMLASGLAIALAVEDGVLTALPAGQQKFTLVASSDSTFAIQIVDAAITFHTEPDGSVDRATFNQGGEVEMLRVKAEALSDSELAALQGRYFSAELDTAYEVSIKDGTPMLHHVSMKPIELKHVEGDRFSTANTILATIEFERDASGAIIGFTVSNDRTRDVRFRKQPGGG